MASGEADLTTGKAAARGSVSPYIVSATSTRNRSIRELKLLQFTLRYVLLPASNLQRHRTDQAPKGRFLHLGEGSGLHVASLALEWPEYTFFPTDKDLLILIDGLRFFDSIAPLPHNLRPPRRFTTEAFCGCECAACVKDRAALGAHRFDVVVANRVGDPFHKPFYLDEMLKGSQLYLEERGVVIGGCWPLEMEKPRSAAVRDLLDAIHGVRDFPVNTAGPAAAALSKRLNSQAEQHSMALELIVHALVGTPGDCTSMCVFRKTRLTNAVVHIFPWHGGKNIAIQTAPKGENWAVAMQSSL